MIERRLSVFHAIDDYERRMMKMDVIISRLLSVLFHLDRTDKHTFPV